MDKIVTHDVVLEDGPLRLRPMTEDDWDFLLRWNSDPEVLFFSEGDSVERRTLEEIQGIYRGTSRKAWVFVAELERRPIGECWLQQMNVARIMRRHPGRRLFRIDLMIGEKDLWGRGYGTRMIRLLTDFGFQRCGADAVLGVGVADYNPRSRRAFEKNGYAVDETISLRPGGKGAVEVDMILTRDEWERQRSRRRGA